MKSPTRIRDDVIFEGSVDSQNIKETPDTFRAGDTTPSVKGIRVAYCDPTTVVTLTNFKGGVNCQRLYLKGHPNTTIQNGTYIRTNTGADKVLVADKIYMFLNIDDVWFEM